GSGEVAAVLFQHVAQFTDRAVFVVGQRIDDYGGAAGPITFVTHFFVADARLFARAATDGSFDVFGRHVRGLRVRDNRTQPRVHVGVAAAAPRGDRQLLDNAGKNLAALGVERAF